MNREVAAVALEVAWRRLLAVAIDVQGVVTAQHAPGGKRPQLLRIAGALLISVGDVEDHIYTPPPGELAEADHEGWASAARERLAERLTATLQHIPAGDILGDSALKLMREILRILGHAEDGP